ncbi:14314_t:CDS:2, partial [Acaulospora morrowiae]
KSEGILYSAGRDGVIASWDLHLPFRKSGPKNKDAQNNRDNEVSEKVDDFKSNWEIDDEIDLSSQPPRKSTFRQSFRGHTDWVNDIILCHNNET